MKYQDSYKNILEKLWVQIDNLSCDSAFDIDNGHLGAAYLSASLYELDDRNDWLACYDRHLAVVFKSLSSNGYPHPGLLGGLAGLGFLIRCIPSQNNRYASAIEKIDHRLSLHLERLLLKWESRKTVNRYDYDFAIGLTGLLYYFLNFPQDNKKITNLVERSIKALAEYSLEENLYHFWTRGYLVPTTMVRQMPAAQFGILDLGQAHGLLGVLGVMLQAMGKDSESVTHLVQVFRQIAEKSQLVGLPYYICHKPGHALDEDSGQSYSDFDIYLPPFLRSVNGPRARNGWCYGSPMLAYYSNKYRLFDTGIVEQLFHSPYYQEPDLGLFDNPGLCHGVAGRIAMNYKSNEKLPERWIIAAENYIDGHTEDKWGFWDNNGGLIATMLCIENNANLPKPFNILGW